MRAVIRLIIGAALSLGTACANAAPCAGFTDTDGSEPFCASVQWLRNQGITQGCSASEFCPNAGVTRLQLAAFLRRLAAATAPALYGADGALFGHYIFGVGAHFTAGERGGPYAAIHRQGRTYYVSLVTQPGSAGDVEFVPPVGKLHYEDAACGTAGRVWMRFEEGPSSAPPSVPLSRWWARLGQDGSTPLNIYGAVARASGDVVPASTRDLVGACVTASETLPASTTFEMTNLGAAGVVFPLVLR